MSILIAGSTGNTGESTVKTLSQLSDAPIIALTRSASNPVAQSFKAFKNVQVVEKDWTTVDVDYLRQNDIKKVFIASHNLSSQFTDESMFLTACLNAGIEYVVRISTYVHFIAPASPVYYGRTHWALEEQLSTPAFSKMNWTSLRPNYFGNMFLFSSALWLKQYKETGKQDTLKIPLDEHEPAALVDSDDVGVVAAHLLSDKNYTAHNQSKYVLAGPKNVTGRDIVDMVERLAGTKVDKVEYRDTDWVDTLPSRGYSRNVLPSMIDCLQHYLWKGTAKVEEAGNSPQINEKATPKTTMDENLTRLCQKLGVNGM